MIKIILGLILCLAIAVPSMWFHHSVYKPISVLTIAIIIGIVIKNLIGLPKVCNPGINFSLKRILRWAIILLGIRMSFLEVLKVGASSIWIIVAYIILALLVVRYIIKDYLYQARWGYS